MFIDLHRGTCLSLELLVAPLGSTIGAWLNSALPAPGTLSRIYFDGNKTIHQGALVAWGAAHGLPVIIHPGCEATDSVSTLMGSLMNAINGSTSISLDELRNVLEDWRMRYNAQLGRDD
ncbi:hypothetical protein [Cupriavidus sp. TMH.W2]|uniref:hypothetical protein n=1 Tax=Cupriavidus sp. TMH.W2 TaxID=3434465 RepID=UPI003D7837F3